VRVWGISSRESRAAVQRFADQYGLTFPILVDDDGSVSNTYHQDQAFPSAAYPQDWIVNSEGTIVYVNNGFELDAMITAIEDDLGG
jgi:peroxiredoxin